MDMLHQLIHALGEPRTWLFVATAVACGVAGWYCADFLFDALHGKEND
ncbi:hypothetical protein [Paraburkholderia rhizosphaerae]|uniref:Uncharacterized protein n=1 Tax=Paraburkholderia rhizosphaerae TaxID=480658 RepID=A0A4R8LPN9_9BURK|nr:hypothetical protein [Paraburkholderia rhizosphaerae]TDY48288.1 hypothetical protein BX592_111223 [Paraburkholderia rhizosphaerae]